MVLQGCISPPELGLMDLSFTHILIFWLNHGKFEGKDVVIKLKRKNKRKKKREEEKNKEKKFRLHLRIPFKISFKIWILKIVL